MKLIKTDKNLSIFQKLKKYFVVEPLLILWILPACFNFVAIQNLGLEKACRVNLNFSQEICTNMLDKSLNNIECDDFDYSTANDSDFIRDINLQHENFSYTVCYSEIETQKLVTISNGIRGPIASIFPIIVILFAGGWSDRYNLRKPCMLFPIIGEVLAQIALLVSSIFFDVFPMEFGNILEKVFPSMFGGSTLMLMGIFSYLTATTEEKDRTFRFGIFGICAGIIPLVGLPFSGTMYNSLGYIKIFAMGTILLICGALYLIFMVEEVQETTLSEESVDATTNTEKNGIDNIAYVNNEERIETKSVQLVETIDTLKNNKCLTFFDPTLAYACIKVFLKERAGHGRLFLILLTISYALFIGPALAEVDYLYQYIKIKLHWSDDEFSVFNTYSSAIVLFGTFLMTSVFSKLLKMSDPMVGFLSAVCTVISRPIYAFSNSLVSFYGAQTVDMFVTPKTIAIKTIMSALVEQEELGRLYSILGIFEAISGAIFPPIYSAVYSSTLDSFPGAYYLFGEIFYVPTALLFGVCYFFLRSKPAIDDDEKQSEEKPEKYTKSANAEESYL